MEITRAPAFVAATMAFAMVLSEPLPVESRTLYSMAVIVLPGARRGRMRRSEIRLAGAPQQLTSASRIRRATASVHEIGMSAIGAGVEDGNFEPGRARCRRREIQAWHLAPR